MKIEAFAPVRHVSMEIAFQVVDTEAAGNAAVSTASATSFSRPGSLTQAEEEATKYMTMEDNLVQTDGTWDIMPAGATVPYWSTELSGDGGNFQTPPAIAFSLSSPASSAGFGLYFDPVALPRQVKIETQAGGNVVSRGVFDVTGPVFTANLPSDNYSRVTVQFLSTQESYRRVRLQRFIFGVGQGLTEDDIVSATITRGCSPVCAAIPSAQLDFIVDNSDGRYNILNPSGFFRYLQTGQPIETYITIDGQQVHTGRFYFTSVRATDGDLTAHVTAHDRVITWGQELFDTPSEHSAKFQDAVKEVLGAGYVYDIPDGLKNRLVGREIPVNKSKREAVRLMCQAARCTCWVRPDGVVAFRSLEDAGDVVVETYTADNMPTMDGMAVRSLDSESAVYTVKMNKGGTVHIAGSGGNVKSVQAPAVIPATAQDVTEWLLSMYRPRVICDFKNRGNPAVLVGDTVLVHNKYGAAEKAAVYEQTLRFDGGLSAETKAIGRRWDR